MSGPFDALDVAVIGGGISGLTAAYALCKNGKRVLLVEASERFGGCMHSLCNGPYLAEVGPQSLVASPPIVELVHELGLDSQFIRASRNGAKRYIYRHGRLNAVPMSPGQFIASPLLSLGAKLRLLAEPFVPRRIEQTDESVAAFVSRRGGHELVPAVAEPVVSGIYAGDAAKLSARSATPILPELEKADGSVLRGAIRRMGQARATGRDGAMRTSAAFSGGNINLIDSLVKELHDSAYTKVRVSRVIPRGAMFALECEGLPERTIETKSVVIATPAADAADLLSPFEPGAAADLRSIEYPPVAQVVLAYPRSAIGIQLDAFGFLVCRSEGVRMLGAVWNSVIFSNRCPDDQVLLTAFLGGATDSAIADCSDEELARITHADLSRIMNIDEDTKPNVVAGFRWARAIPQYTLGHRERLERIAAAVSRVPGVTLIGNYLHGPSVSDCIRVARTAVERL